MASISTLMNAFSPLGSGNNLTSTGSANANATQAIEQALTSAEGASQNDSNAYMLDLSPDAQQLLNNGSPASGSNFVLTQAQQTTIETILNKYKNAPYTQATFNQIESDLTAAGLGTQQLSLEDEARNFNPTGVFLSALNGDYTDPTTQASINSSTEQSKSNNYLQTILKAWQSVSTTYSSSAA